MKILKTIMFSLVICAIISPAVSLAKGLSLDAKLIKTEATISALWKKTHHFESQCPAKDNAAIAKNIIADLEKIRRDKPNNSKMDKILFMLAQAKTVMVDMCNCYSDLDDYCTSRGEKEYLNFFGINYMGQEYEALIKQYPRSPLLEDAMFYHASDMAHTGECESDIDCHIRRAINAYSPFIQKYPTDKRVQKVVDEINRNLRMITWNPKENGLSEIFDIENTTILIKHYKSVVAKLPDSHMRAESLYLLARAFISVGQFKIADEIYNDLESHYPNYRNAKSRAAYLVIDYSENGKGQVLKTAKLAKYTAYLSDPSETERLRALNRIKNANIQDRPLLFSLLLAVGTLSEKDVSSIVRRHSIEIIGKLAPQTSFFRAVVGYCIVHDPDNKNQYYCAQVGIKDPNLTSTAFYAYNQERINKIIFETTGKKYPSDELLEEWQNRAMQRDAEVAEELQRRMKEFKERKQ